MDPKIFKAYDIRGVYPEEIDEDAVFRIAGAFCDFVKPREVVIGSDIRLSSPALKKAAIAAVTQKGIKVIDVGEISTDMLYFAVANYGYSGGFSITASHNPKEYNGMKLVRENAKPISADSGIFEIRDLAFFCKDSKRQAGGVKYEAMEDLVEYKHISDDYVSKIKDFADFGNFKPFKIVANANFGLAGRVIRKLLEGTSTQIIPLNFEPDGNFPKGRPDPLISENRTEISEMIVRENADFGVAWDADADRCFFFTEKGEFIEGYFITALLAEIFLKRKSNEKIIHDTRLTWAIRDSVESLNGTSVPVKAGHSFIKESMSREDAVFGGEMSAHYYFRDYFYADNGMIPLVMMLEFLSEQDKSLSEIMKDKFFQKYFVSGEINTRVENAKKTIEKIKNLYKDQAANLDFQDGIAFDFVNKKDAKDSWRFSLRCSNTEPLLRLNVEAYSEKKMLKKRDELLAIIENKFSYA